MAPPRKHIKNYAMLAFLNLALYYCTAKYESPPSNPSAAPFTFSVNLPGYPNKRFSAYIFNNGALVGVVRSNNLTDAKGSLKVTASAVDANNCATGGSIVTNSSAYSMHFRLDAAGSNSWVYPSNCAGDAGFLNVANLGYAYNYPYLYWPMDVSSMYLTNTVSYSFSGTGVGSVTRPTYCSIVDAQIANPTIYTSSTLGYSQGNVVFTGGSGTATSTARVVSASSGTYKYTCWIDADNSGTYNSGDKIATATDPLLLSTWTTVP